MAFLVTEQLLFALLMEIGTMAGFAFLMWYIFIRKTPKLIFTAKIGGIRRIIKEVKYNISENTKIVKIGKKERRYMINPKFAIENKKGKPIIYYDKDDVEPLNIGGDMNRNPEDLNNLIDNEYIKGFLKGDKVRIYIIIILILAIGLTAMAMFTMYVVQNPEQFIHTAVNGTKTIVTTTQHGGVSPVIPK